MGNKALEATSWTFLAEFSAKIIVPLTNMILARILVPSVFGIIVIVNMVISFADMVTSAGFQKYLVQHDFEDKEKLHNSADVAFWANLCISFLAVVIILIFHKEIAQVVGGKGHGLEIVVASIALPLTSLSSIYEALYKRNFNFKILFIIRIAICLVPVIITVPLALLGFGAWSLIIGTLSGHILKNIIFWFTAKDWKPRLYFSFRELKEMLSYGLWTLFESIVSWFITWVDVFLVSNAFDTFYTGLYKTSQSTVSSMLSIITATTQPVIFSVLSREKNNIERFKTSFLEYTRITAVIIIPMGVGFLAYSTLITKILLGNQWLEASRFIGLWGFSTAIVCLVGDLNREAYKACGLPNVSFYVQLSHLIFMIPVCILFVQKGFSVFTLIRPFVYMEISIVHFFCTCIIFKFRILDYLKTLFVPCISSGVMFLAAMGMKQAMTDSIIVGFIQIFVCIILYFGMLMFFPYYRHIVQNLYAVFVNKFHFY